MFNVFLKTLRDKRYFILGWSLGLLFLGFMMTSFYPSFSGGQIDQLLDSLPPAFQGLVGNVQDWRELPGYLGSQLFDIRLPIFISILSILLAIGLTVGEEDKGQLRTLIALPVSRRKIAFGKWLAIVVICLVASLATVVGVEIGIAVIQKTLDQSVIVRLGLFTWLLVTALATIIYAIGLSTGKRAITTGVAIIVAIGSFLLSTFGQAVDWLADYEKFSFFYYFPAVNIAKDIVDWGNILFYAVIIVLGLLATLIFFPRRDVK
ncbi:hypothetical protein BGO18_00470 [Candidatus Saccharibacteria bacterium 47-87]|jgi:ABC-2 type transport system permease protein|nr:ABC transporter permease subunit [Candidatus Saccharibacteria bacterium]OJU96656.1 MAG: hypothetical protein BGO18_00470 [Candidatus Saccharibacteria bacterium 47-87]